MFVIVFVVVFIVFGLILVVVIFEEGCGGLKLWKDKLMCCDLIGLYGVVVFRL